jgi:hypothetical protein
VGEVDELDDPVDHRVAERHDRVDAAQRQAVDHLLQENVQSTSPQGAGGALAADEAPRAALAPGRGFFEFGDCAGWRESGQARDSFKVDEKKRRPEGRRFVLQLPFANG